MVRLVSTAVFKLGISPILLDSGFLSFEGSYSLADLGSTLLGSIVRPRRLSSICSVDRQTSQ